MTGIGNITPNADNTVPVNPSAPVRADAQTTGLAATTGNTATAATTVSSMNDLKSKAPEVYQAMMKGLAQTMIKQWERAEKRRERIAKAFER